MRRPPTLLRGDNYDPPRVSQNRVRDGIKCIRSIIHNVLLCAVCLCVSMFVLLILPHIKWTPKNETNGTRLIPLNATGSTLELVNDYGELHNVTESAPENGNENITMDNVEKLPTIKRKRAIQSQMGERYDGGCRINSDTAYCRSLLRKLQDYRYQMEEHIRALKSPSPSIRENETSKSDKIRVPRSVNYTAASDSIKQKADLFEVDPKASEHPLNLLRSMTGAEKEGSPTCVFSTSSKLQLSEPDPITVDLLLNKKEGDNTEMPVMICYYTNPRANENAEGKEHHVSTHYKDAEFK